LKKRKEAAAQRIEAEKRAAQKAEEERVLALAAQNESIAAQREQRELRRLQTLYFNSIRQRVERSWRKPPGLRGKVNCTVSVLQSVVGEVLKVSVDSCEGGTVALRKSVENAVRAASPLPAAPDPKLFDRQVRFYFRPS